MKTQQLYGILLLVGIVCLTLLFKVTLFKLQPVDSGVYQEKVSYEQEKFRLKRDTLKRNDTLKFYGIFSLLGALELAVLIAAAGAARAKVRTASVLMARIGKHRTIPVRHKDLPRFYQVAVNLSLAEIEASRSTSHERAYQISRQMLEDVTQYTRALTGFSGHRSSAFREPNVFPPELPRQQVVPDFAELLSTGLAAPGKPLVLGFSQGQPQFRQLHDLKSVAIAGWQGSGKTLSTAYMIASSVLAYGVRTYVIDPHQHHAESLSSVIQPLEHTGLVTIVPPFDTSAVIHDLNHHLERRLAGEEPSQPGILLVIDELARLAKMECFDLLIEFLERCTEETRKANITFFGSSPKWTARHFKGRADIRGCMNSMLIHKTKPSQAELLLEDRQEKQLVKQLRQPGEAILVTDFDQPTLVSIPLCTRKDMEAVAEKLSVSKKGTAAKETNRARPSPSQQRHHQPLSSVESFFTDLAESAVVNAAPTQRGMPAAVIPFVQRRRKYRQYEQKPFDPLRLTIDDIIQQWHSRKQASPELTQAEIARQAGMSPSTLSKLLRRQQALSDKYKLRLYEVLYADTPREQFAASG